MAFMQAELTDECCRWSGAGWSAGLVPGLAWIVSVRGGLACMWLLGWGEWAKGVDRDWSSRLAAWLALEKNPLPQAGTAPSDQLVLAPRHLRAPWPGNELISAVANLVDRSRWSATHFAANVQRYLGTY